MLIFWSLVRNSVVLAVYLLFSVACFLTVHEHHVLVAIGLAPCRSLAEELKAIGKQVTVVGDCSKVGKIYDAIHSGYKAGLRV